MSGEKIGGSCKDEDTLASGSSLPQSQQSLVGEWAELQECHANDHHETAFRLNRQHWMPAGTITIKDPILNKTVDIECFLEDMRTAWRTFGMGEAEITCSSIEYRRDLYLRARIGKATGLPVERCDGTDRHPAHDLTKSDVKVWLGADGKSLCFDGYERAIRAFNKSAEASVEQTGLQVTDAEGEVSTWQRQQRDTQDVTAADNDKTMVDGGF